jgi:hypothetical protein
MRITGRTRLILGVLLLGAVLGAFTAIRAVAFDDDTLDADGREVVLSCAPSVQAGDELLCSGSDGRYYRTTAGGEGFPAIPLPDKHRGPHNILQRLGPPQ